MNWWNPFGQARLVYLRRRWAREEKIWAVVAAHPNLNGLEIMARTGLGEGVYVDLARMERDGRVVSGETASPTDARRRLYRLAGQDTSHDA